MNPTSTLVSEQQKFADRVAQYLPYLSRVVGNLTGRDQVAEDIVQQTILKALMHADQFRFESTLKTWPTSIAVNEVHQAYRTQWRRRTVPLVLEILDLDGSRKLEFSHDNYEADERDLLLRHAVSQLPGIDRCVVELCDLQRVPMKDAARKLGLTLPAVKSRRHRARQKLRRLVARLNRS